MTTVSADPWGTCVGEDRLCEDGTVRNDPAFTCGYACTGGRHIGPGQYIRCTDLSHSPARADGRGPAGHCRTCQCSSGELVITGVTFFVPSTVT